MGGVSRGAAKMGPPGFYEMRLTLPQHHGERRSTMKNLQFKRPVAVLVPPLDRPAKLGAQFPQHII